MLAVRRQFSAGRSTRTRPARSFLLGSKLSVKSKAALSPVRSSTSAPVSPMRVLASIDIVTPRAEMRPGPDEMPHSD